VAEAPTLIARDQPLRAGAELRALAIGGGAWFSDLPGMLPGGGVRVVGSARQLGWMLDAQVHDGRATFPAGTVKTDVFALGAALTFHIAADRVRFDAGAGVRGGAVRMRGVADSMDQNASSSWSPWWGAFVRSAGTLQLAPRIWVELGVEAGRVLAPVTGLVDGVRAVAVDGNWLGLDLGIGFQL
jgi:hypothetical protein